jgi:hypothetical protein
MKSCCSLYIPLFPPPPKKNMFAGTWWKGVPGYLQLLTPHDYGTVAGVDTDWKRLVGLHIWYFAYLLNFSPHYILYAVYVRALSMVLIVTFTSLIWKNISWKQSWLLGYNLNTLESSKPLWIQNYQQHYFQFRINGPVWPVHTRVCCVWSLHIMYYYFLRSKECKSRWYSFLLFLFYYFVEIWHIAESS